MTVHGGFTPETLPLPSIPPFMTSSRYRTVDEQERIYGTATQEDPTMDTTETPTTQVAFRCENCGGGHIAETTDSTYVNWERDDAPIRTCPKCMNADVGHSYDTVHETQVLDGIADERDDNVPRCECGSTEFRFTQQQEYSGYTDTSGDEEPDGTLWIDTSNMEYVDAGDTTVRCYNCDEHFHEWQHI